MTTHVFDVDQFREEFPAFADDTDFPDQTLQGYWNIAILYISPEDSCVLNGDTLQFALNLMTAHLTQQGVIVAKGQNPFQLNSASVDKVSVGLIGANNLTQYQWWLGTTSYGAQLLALLQVCVVGGFFIAGLPEGSAFRKVGGVF